MEEIIAVRGAKAHNLKDVNIDIPRNKLVVITGLSGSGKSSLAFDTIYAEGQRRYVESLSAYARQFLKLQDKPDVESITGLSPAIAIDQKTISRNPRSTVGTITEIYDYLRILYARAGIPYSPATGLPIQSQTVSQMVDEIMKLSWGTKIYILSPIARGQKGEFRKEIMHFKKQGFQRMKVDGIIYDLDDEITIEKNKKHDIFLMIDRLVIDEDSSSRLSDSVETALKLGSGIVNIEILSLPETGANQNSKHKTGDELIFSEKFACPISGFQIAEIEPRIFSFNSPYGACEKCDGIGKEKYFDPELVVPNKSLSLMEGAIVPWNSNMHAKTTKQLFVSIAKHYNFDLNTPFSELSQSIQNIILSGSGEEKIIFEFNDGMRKNKVEQIFEGVIPYLSRKKHEAAGSSYYDELIHYQSERECCVCKGYRLKNESLCVKIADYHIGQVSNLTIVEADDWFLHLPKMLSNTQNKIAERVIKEIKHRLEFLKNVGLDYLTLSRESGTLSGGESQRIRLASQIGSGLTGVLYVLDEPSIGLHQSDNTKLIKTLENLRDMGNTVIVVEHDDETMRAADHLIDIGPGAGVYGGRIIAEGTPQEVENNPNSITGQYMKGIKKIIVPKTRRAGHVGKEITLTGATSNNLQDVDLTIPLGKFVCVTGVSGSGKSTLVIHTFYKAAIKTLEKAKVTPNEYRDLQGIEYIDKIIEIDQSPIGRTPRSNPATYTGAFTPIRDWFVELPESKARGYKAGRFSFNVKGGRCEACQGDGVIKIEMHFLPDVYVKCDVCDGKRYNRETLEIKYKEKSISDVLAMTVDEASIYFDHVPSIRDKLVALKEVGLGYIIIGQSATTLSGGEAQRVKLAKELSKRSTGKTLYILDEPTTGLHSDDINKLLGVLHTLVDNGNSVIVIEHNLDVVKTADHVIDVGPGGGDKGGKVIGACTPEELINIKESITGKYLQKYLEI